MKLPRICAIKKKYFQFTLGVHHQFLQINCYKHVFKLSGQGQLICILGHSPQFIRCHNSCAKIKICGERALTWVFHEIMANKCKLLIFSADLEQTRLLWSCINYIQVFFDAIVSLRFATENDFHFLKATTLRGHIKSQRKKNVSNDIGNDGDDDATANDTSKIFYCIVKRLRDFRFLLFPFQSRLSHLLRTKFPISVAVAATAMLRNQPNADGCLTSAHEALPPHRLQIYT